MTSQNALAEATHSVEPPGAADPDAVTIETRFGAIDFQLQNAIRMPRGMLGFADYHSFGLANLPDPKLAHFKLFQCLDEASLSFVVAPLIPGSDTIEPGDIESACETLAIDPANVLVLLVVSTRAIGATTQVSVNLRAPIILDGTSQIAHQHVLMNNKYPVRQVIGTSAPAAD